MCSAGKKEKRRKRTSYLRTHGFGDEAISIPNGQALPLGAVATAPQDPLSITSATIATQQAAGLEAFALAGAEQSEILVT